MLLPPMDGTRPRTLHVPQPASTHGLITTKRWRWLVFALCLLLGLICGGLFLAGALSAPRRTPLLVLSACYAPPWDLNPWAGENTQLLQQLDRRGLSVTHSGDGTDIADGQWTKLDEQILAALTNHSSMPLLLYINLHGTVDDAGEPRLIPPHEDAVDPRTWISVWEFLEHVDQLLNGKSRSVVLFFESGRSSPQAPATEGLTSFAGAMQKLLDSRAGSLQLSNLHVLLSTVDSHPTTTDWKLGCDLFTRELSCGLYGAADQSAHQGNHDGFVQFSELANYVRRQVGSWSLQHRGTCQSVWSWSRDSADTALAWTLGGDFQFPEPLLTPTTQDLEQLHQAWRQVAQLHDHQAWRAFPSQWQALCDGMLGYEQAVYGGKLARAQMPSLASALLERTDWLEKHLANHNQPQTIEQRVAAAQAIIWHAVAPSPSLSSAQNALAVDKPTAANQLGGVPLLEQMTQNPRLTCWNQTQMLSRYARLRGEVATLQATATHRTPISLSAHWQQLRRIELQVDDSLLADIDSTQIEDLINRYETSFKAWCHTAQQYQLLIDSRDDVIATLPEIGQCLLSVTHVGTFNAKTDNANDEYYRVEDQLSLLCRSTANVCDTLAAPTSGLELDGLPDLQSFLLPLVDHQSRLWEQLLSDTLESSPSNLARLHCLVNYTWFPHDVESASNLGLLRSKAWSRLREWEHRLATTNVDAAEDHELDNTPSVAPPLDQEFPRFFAACINGTSRSRSLSPAEFRDWLRRVGNQSVQITEEKLSLDAVPQWHHAELEARLAASLASVEESTESIAIHQELAIAHRLLSFAHETLEGFWASPHRDDHAYFSWLATAAVDEARSFEARIQERAVVSKLNAVSALTTAVDQRIAPSKKPSSAPSSSVSTLSLAQRRTLLGELLGRREQVMTTGLASQSRWLPDVDTSLWQDEAALAWFVQVQVRAGKTYADAPSGIAAVALQSDGHELRQPLPLDSQFSEVPLSFRCDWLATINANQNRANEIKTTLAFRGHEFGNTLSGQPSPGRGVRLDYSKSSTSSLTIFDKSRAAQKRSFILDCSASMDEDAAGETERAQVNPTAPRMNKLEAAKLALLNLLRDMRDGEDQVSVLLYGHRVAQGSTEQGTLRQTKYLEKFPIAESIEAYEDVETILPMGRFGETEYQQIRQRLDAIVPWGQTPLYLALSQALQSTKEGARPHDVVIISDGKNYQFNPSPDKRIEAEQVIQLAQSRHARVHVIGFGVPADQVAVSAQQFESLAHGTDGTATMQLADASLLNQRMNELRAPPTFRVIRVDESTLIGRANERLTLPTPTADEEKIAIEYGGRSYFVPLYPGAALRMSVDARGHLIPSSGTEASAGIESFRDVTHQPTEILASLHPPLRVADGLRWKLSFSRQDAQVPSRPARAMIELQPLSSRQTTSTTFEPYIIVSNNWSPDTPLPMLEFTAVNWPADADRARAYVWIQPQTSQARNAQQEGQHAAYECQVELGDLEWNPLAGVQVHMHSSDQIVTAVVCCDHEQSISDWTLALDSPLLRTAATNTHRASNTSIYRFELPSRDDAAADLNFVPRAATLPETLKLLSLTQFKQQAWALTAPIEIELPRPLTALAPTSSSLK